MASMQCYRPTHETYEAKCHDNSYGHKVTEMVGNLFKGDHHGQGSGQAHCYGQNQGHNNLNHTYSKTHTECHCQTQTYYSAGNSGAKTHSNINHSVSQSHGHGLHSNHHSSHGKTACHVKKDKKMTNKCEYKEKEKSHRSKRRDGNRSCSESSDSDSD